MNGCSEFQQSISTSGESGFKCIWTILLLEREKVLSKPGKTWTCVTSGWWVSRWRWFILCNMSWWRATPLEFYLELYSASLSGLYRNRIGCEETALADFLPHSHKVPLFPGVHQSTHKCTLSLASTFCICLPKYFFFLNLSLIRKHVGNSSWQDLTGVCCIFPFYT